MKHVPPKSQGPKREIWKGYPQGFKKWELIWQRKFSINSESHNPYFSCKSDKYF